MGGFHFENVENSYSRKLHDIIDMFNLTQSFSELSYNQGHLLNLVFSKQTDIIIISIKLHHGLTFTTQPSCANSMYLYPYKNLKFSRTDASKKIDTGMCVCVSIKYVM